jgi:DNA-binding transcriptional ArsR family regulator
MRLLQDQKKMTVTELSESIDLSPPEISRHLSKLMEFTVVQKTDDRKYRITNYGITILSLFSPLEYIFERHDYFCDHPITTLPLHLQLRINELKQAEFVEGTGLVMLKMQEIIENTQESIQVMVDQPFPFGKGQIHAKYIVPPLPDLFNIDNLKPLELKSIDARLYDPLPVGMSISDAKYGLLFFPDSHGKIDYSSVFIINDELGLKFIHDIWDWVWENGTLPDLL